VGRKERDSEEERAAEEGAFYEKASLLSSFSGDVGRRSNVTAFVQKQKV